jgi:hypothetical protein
MRILAKGRFKRSRENEALCGSWSLSIFEVQDFSFSFFFCKDENSVCKCYIGDPFVDSRGCCFTM